jgi:hypothetical protein
MVSRITFPLILALAGLAAGEPASSSGFRGDGSGVFAEARPPADFDGPSGRGILWRAPLPNWGNGSPIVAGRKAFVVCEAATPATATSPLVDTPLLLCFDAGSGKELWRRQVDPFDSVPDQGVAAQLRKLRREYYETAHRQNLAGEGSVYRDWQGYKAFMAKFAPYGYWDNSMWGRTGMGYCMPTPVSDGTRVFVFTGHRVMAAFDLNGNRLWQQFHHQAQVPWGANTEYCGHSPLYCEGKVLLHFLIEGKGEPLGLRCYDAGTGKVLWTTPTEQLPHNAMGSPVLLMLPKPGGGVEPAVFCFSGELVRARDGKVLADRIGWGRRCAGFTGDGVDRIFMACGWHGAAKREPDEPWRQPKGRFGISDDKAPLNQEQRLNICVKFALKADAAEPQLLWAHRGGPDDGNLRNWTGRRNLDPYPVYHAERLYLACGQVWDAKTGQVVGQRPANLKNDLGEQGIVMAGGHVFGQADNQSKDCTVSVTRVTAQGLEGTRWLMLEKRNGNPAWQTDEWKSKVKAETGSNGLSLWHGWHPSFALPFASGNRLYVRTFDYLWCIGSKE